MTTEIFTFNPRIDIGIDKDIRVGDIDGKPWFVAKDVCVVLGLTDARNHLRKLGAGEKKMFPRSNVNLARAFSFPNRGANCVSESGLYKLIMRSDKPEAKCFQDWVTGTVLPAIHKNGVYVAGEEKAGSGEISEDELIAKAQEILQRKVGRL